MKAVVKATTTHKGIAIAKVKELRKLYGEMQSLFLAALDKAIRMGEILSDIKAELPHGQFQTWVNSSGLPFKDRSARLYMRLAKHKEQIQLAGINGIEEAYKFISSGTTVDESKRQDLTVLENQRTVQTTSIQASSGEILVFDEEDLASIKLTARERQLVADIVSMGGDKQSAENGIRKQKLKAKIERERRQKEREKKKDSSNSHTHFKNLEVPPNLYRRFARVAKLTGRPITDILQEAADALVKQQKKK